MVVSDAQTTCDHRSRNLLFLHSSTGASSQWRPLRHGRAVGGSGAAQVIYGDREGLGGENQTTNE